MNVDQILSAFVVDDVLMGFPMGDAPPLFLAFEMEAFWLQNGCFYVRGIFETFSKRIFFFKFFRT